MAKKVHGEFVKEQGMVYYAVLAVIFLLLWFIFVGLLDAIIIFAAYFIGYKKGKMS